MINNEVRNSQGEIIGFRCAVCDEVKSKMLGTICHQCQAVEESNSWRRVARKLQEDLSAERKEADMLREKVAHLEERISVLKDEFEEELKSVKKFMA